MGEQERASRNRKYCGLLARFRRGHVRTSPGSASEHQPTAQIAAPALFRTLRFRESRPCFSLAHGRHSITLCIHFRHFALGPVIVDLL